MVTRLGAVAVAVAFGAVAAACGSETPSGGVRVADSGARDAAATESSARPDGSTLYAEHCASCHGADLRGTEDGPSQLSVVYEPGHHGDDSYRRAIRFGAAPHHWNFGTMPPNDELDDAEIDAVIAFIRAEQERLGFEPYPP